MFRIDKSSVEYQKSSSPYLVTVRMPATDKAQPEDEAQEAGSNGSPSAAVYDDSLQSAARAEADGIILKARTAAAKIKNEAIKEAESIKTQAYDEALKRGEKEAQKREREREKAGRQEIAQLLSRLNESLNTSLEETVNIWEEELLDLSIAIARKIINVELERNDEAFKSLVQNALSHMRGDAKVTVHVSPKEFEKYFQEGDAIFQLGGEKVKILVTEDPLLERGGCVVESEGEMINAGVEQQLQAMRTTMETDGVS